MVTDPVRAPAWGVLSPLVEFVAGALLLWIARTVQQLVVEVRANPGDAVR